MEETLLEATLVEIEKLSELNADWDSYGAYPVSAQSLTHAKQLVMQVYAYTRFLPDITTSLLPTNINPCPNGNVLLHWDTPRQEIEVEVHPNTTFSYLLVHKNAPSKNRYSALKQVKSTQIIMEILRIFNISLYTAIS